MTGPTESLFSFPEIDDGRRGDLWGCGDLHAHLMAHLAFGGRTIWGKPHDDRPGHDGGVESCLGPCRPLHGWWGLRLNPEGPHRVLGFPRFEGWPRYSSLAHQQAFVDWVRRAYEGGLRLVCSLAVNNELLARRFGSGGAADDRSSIDLQIAAMRQAVAFVDAQCGGPGSGWMRIAESPQAARKIIKEGKLAVVLGVEVDSVGNWRTEEDLPADPEQARPLLRQELERLYGMGVRQITPIHLTDNAFGGAAIYNRLFDGLNKQITGHHFLVEDAWDTGVRYRLDRDPGMPGLRGFLARWLAYGSPFPRRQRDPSHSRHGGHANSRGLTKHGHVLVEEIMRLGLILDVDHMSQRATDATLDLAEHHAYPIILSHTWFRDLAFTVEGEDRAEFGPGTWKRYGTSDVQKVAHEAGKRADQVHRIRRLGGIVAPILNQGDVRTHDARIPNDCPGSSKSWAQAYLYALDLMQGRGVAFGSDVNGLARLPGPRFGTDAAYPLINDKIRGRLRRSCMDRQSNGVRYEETVHDLRRHRWEAMVGNNTPLRRSTAGDRAFDINVDGIAHYGLLPDFFQDLRNSGLTHADLAPLFRSADDYIRVWERCDGKARDGTASIDGGANPP